jgi:hypothetical protein
VKVNRIESCIKQRKVLKWIFKDGRKWAVSQEGIAVLKQASEEA